MRWYARVAEAWCLLVLAMLLVRHVRLARWRWTLGPPVDRPDGGCPVPDDFALARAVDRASQRLAPPPQCLPRALALHWMRQRRGRAGQLVLATLPGSARGTLDDLHAWAEVGGVVLIGEYDEPFVVVARFG